MAAPALLAAISSLIVAITNQPKRRADRVTQAFELVEILRKDRADDDPYLARMEDVASVVSAEYMRRELRLGPANLAIAFIMINGAMFTVGGVVAADLGGGSLETPSP